MRQSCCIVLLILLSSVLFFVSCGDDGSVNLPATTITSTPTPGSTTSTISGTVYGTNGEVIDGITVRLTPSGEVAGSESYGEVQTFTTSDGGQYNFSVCYAGVYLLEALNDSTLLDSQECTISLGVNVNVILGTPSNVGSLKIKVTEDGSTPIEGAVIFLTETLETSDNIKASYYYSEGWYIFENLFLQDYELTVNVDGYETYTDTVTIGVTTPPVEEVVTLAVVASPTITGFSPSSASAGVVVTIEGTNFMSVYTENTVSFNGIEGTVLSAGPTEIRATVPEGATTGAITVITPGGTALSASDLVILEMILIESGTYPAGSDNYIEGTAVNAFYIGKYEVTNAEYEMYDSAHSGSWSDSDYPVETVSWYDAATYCNWLSGQHGLELCYTDENPVDGNLDTVDTSKNGYRLPDDIEWEYACRAGTSTDYFWEEDYPLPTSSQIDQYCWYSANSIAHPHEVTSLNPNLRGLYHMSGNVWEWCNDSLGTTRVFRGGSCENDVNYCRSSVRFNGDPTNFSPLIGFRLCRSAP